MVQILPFLSGTGIHGVLLLPLRLPIKLLVSMKVDDDHCLQLADIRGRNYFFVTGAIFSLSWLHGQIRILLEHGLGQRAELALMPNGFIRVSISTSSTWTVGQHFFVRFLSPGAQAWTTHPFTACSLPKMSCLTDSQESELVFYIRPQGGFTFRLAHIAEAHPNKKMRVLLDGPYGASICARSRAANACSS